MGRICVLDNAQALQHAVAKEWVAIAAQSISDRGCFNMALSGGSTPKNLFELISSSEYSASLDWGKCHLFFGDERFVPADHEDSNFRMAKLAMFDRIHIPVENIHPVNTAMADAHASAQAYANTLKEHLPLSDEGVPIFDLMLQGVGGDGHTASLFPGTDILNERDKEVAAAWVEKFKSWRISVTFPVINAARNIIVLVSGETKADIANQLLVQPVPETPYPIQMIEPQGQLSWYLDKDAASQLPKEIMMGSTV